MQLHRVLLLVLDGEIELFRYFRPRLHRPGVLRLPVVVRGVAHLGDGPGEVSLEVEGSPDLLARRRLDVGGQGVLPGHLVLLEVEIVRSVDVRVAERAEPQEVLPCVGEILLAGTVHRPGAVALQRGAADHLGGVLGLRLQLVGEYVPQSHRAGAFFLLRVGVRLQLVLQHVPRVFPLGAEPSRRSIDGREDDPVLPGVRRSRFRVDVDRIFRLHIRHAHRGEVEDLDEMVVGHLRVLLRFVGVLVRALRPGLRIPILPLETEFEDGKDANHVRRVGVHLLFHLEGDAVRHDRREETGIFQFNALLQFLYVRRPRFRLVDRLVPVQLVIPGKDDRRRRTGITREEKQSEQWKPERFPSYRSGPLLKHNNPGSLFDHHPLSTVSIGAIRGR